MLLEGVSEDKANRYFILVFLFGVALRLLELNTMTYSDEGMYVYMAKLVYGGYRPYEDFFMSQPPLYHYLTSVVFAFFGVGLVQAKIVPILFSILSIPLVYVIARRFYGLRYGLLAALLFALSPGVVANTRNAVLYSELVFFSLLASYLFLQGLESRSRWSLFFSGVFIGLATFSRLFGLSLLVFVLITLFVARRKEFAGFFATILLGFVIVSSIFVAYFYSPSFIYQVFVHHAFFQSLSLAEKVNVFFENVFIYYSLILASAIAGLFLVLRKRDKTPSDYYFAVYFLLSIAFFFTLKYYKWINLYMYFAFASPAMAVLGGRVAVFLKERHSILLVLVVFNLMLLPNHAILLSDLKWDSNLRLALDYTMQNTRSGDKIAGSSSSTPYIAFLSDRSIPPDLVEYSIYRSQVGEPRQAEEFSNSSKDIVLFFLLADDSAYNISAKDLSNRSFLKDAEIGNIVAFRRTYP